MDEDHLHGHQHGSCQCDCPSDLPALVELSSHEDDGRQCAACRSVQGSRQIQAFFCGSHGMCATDSALRTRAANGRLSELLEPPQHVDPHLHWMGLASHRGVHHLGHRQQGCAGPDYHARGTGAQLPLVKSESVLWLYKTSHRSDDVRVVLGSQVGGRRLDSAFLASVLCRRKELFACRPVLSYLCVTIPDDNLLVLFLSHCEASGPRECRVAVAPFLVWCLVVAG
mmetsp:Transcript_44189/g.117039  ORF Transcript_44189/g.117039 Transcript_44189/m.117039 type:complete len:226 (+) Transcript_44189:980-1657(+)